jgi:CRP-like cAMP-binding protein
MFNISSLFRTAGAEVRTIPFRKNQFVFCQGAPSDSLFFIETGTVKLTVTSASGKEAVIGLYDAGMVFGESSLISREAVRFHNAIAVTRVRALRIDGLALLRQLRSNSAAASELLTWSLMRSREIQQELVSHLLASSEQRLADVLCSVARLGDKTGMPPRLTQQDLANRIGVSRQRVNILIGRLRKSGIIDRDGRLGSVLTTAEAAREMPECASGIHGRAR